MKFNHGLTFTERMQYACLGLLPLLFMIGSAFLVGLVASMFVATKVSGEINHDPKFATGTKIPDIVEADNLRIISQPCPPK